MTTSGEAEPVAARRTAAPVVGGDEFTYAVLDLPAGAAPGGRERRGSGRRRTRLRSGKIVGLDGRFIVECLIANRSAAGALLRMQGAAALPARVLVYDDQRGELLPAAVVWRRDRQAGVRFLAFEPSERTRAIADAMRRKFYAMRR